MSVQSGEGAGDGAAGEPERLTVLVYASRVAVRERVRAVLGSRPSPELPELDYVEVSTADEVLARADVGSIDLAILDGEAAPAGGMGVCRQIKDEVASPSPVLLLTGRRDDAWLASWSRAEAVVAQPLDAVTLTDAVVALLAERIAPPDEPAAPSASDRATSPVVHS
jgi:DNA-binding response OmpR family regulator